MNVHFFGWPVEGVTVYAPAPLSLRGARGVQQGGRARSCPLFAVCAAPMTALTNYKDTIRWEFNWQAAGRYTRLEPNRLTGALARDPTIRRRTPTPKKRDDGSAVKWNKQEELDAAINEASAMGFWTPYTGYTLGGKDPIPGWTVEQDPANAKGYRRERNTNVKDWVQKDSRTFEVQMLPHAASVTGRATTKHVQRLTHPMPDDPIWMKEPIQARNGVITPAAKPIDVDVRARLTEIQSVDTVASTATLQIDLDMFWTDLRMIGYDHHVLPYKLWSPRLNMLRIVDVKETQVAFMRLEVGACPRLFPVSGSSESLFRVELRGAWSVFQACVALHAPRSTLRAPRSARGTDREADADTL
jgi:hypothetical protein